MIIKLSLYLSSILITYYVIEHLYSTMSINYIRALQHFA